MFPAMCGDLYSKKFMNNIPIIVLSLNEGERMDYIKSIFACKFKILPYNLYEP